MKKITKKQIEKLAFEIREFLLEHELWQDVCIYYNHKRMSCRNPETGQYHYNDKLFIEEGIEPQEYFEYINPEHILSMSFEGPVCEMLYYGEMPDIKQKFDTIFEKYGLYYEFGEHWNFSCYLS